jgi:hypothetical protein
VPIWFVIKSIAKDVLSNENTLKELKSLKELFILDFLSKKVSYTNGLEDLRGLNFGNRSAAVKLTVIVSPSCVHS